MAMNTRLDVLNQVLLRFGESIHDEFSPEYAHIADKMRDSVIKRFELAVDVFWKCLKDVLEEQHEILVASPKACLRQSFEQNIISEEEYNILVDMVEDRNDTSHNYNENVANQIARKAQKYKNMMQQVAIRLQGLMQL